jgi:hypothetical protein
MNEILPVAVIKDHITGEVLTFDSLDDAKEELRVLWERVKGSARLIINPRELEHGRHVKWVSSV